MTIQAMITTTIAVGLSTGFTAGWLTKGKTALKEAPTAKIANFEPTSNEEAPPKIVAAAKADEYKPGPEFGRKIAPFLNQYCIGCHNADKQAGGVELHGFKSELDARKDRKTWESIQHVILAGEMPPKKSKAQPTKEEKEYVVEWISKTLTKVDCNAPKNPGRVTMRRLNRAEYNNTVRDLLGVSFQPANDFPSDDVGYGFDNIGDVLSFQPLLFEKYLAAADKILDTALPAAEPVKSVAQVFRPQNLPVVPRSAKTRETSDKGKNIDRIIMKEEAKAYLEKFNFPAEGEYIIRSRAYGTSADGQAPKLAFRVNDREIKQISVDSGKATTYEAKFRMTPGEKKVEVAFVNPSANKDRVLNIDTLEVEGPIGGAWPPVPEMTKKLLGEMPKQDSQNAASARRVLKDFAAKAYRRPLRDDELGRLMQLYDMATAKGDKYVAALKLPMKSVLVSPNFLFRIEEDPKNPDEVKLISEFELATRMSYFLWSSMPDAELYGLAERGELRKPGVLEAQVKRMLKDPKATALTENFAGQWLMLRNIRLLTPDKAAFPKWDEALRKSAIRETELFFEHIVKEDRSVLEFLDADYTFLNERLATHYGVSGVSGNGFQKVSLKDKRRGGIVTQTSMLLVTSNPTRTSPVKRGKWVYENILGLTAPPAAPDVPELEAAKLATGTVRQVLEQHRSNASCASCHAKLDPLGFGLENFDGIGSWRDTENKVKIDASGVLPDGSKFDGPQELRRILMQKSDQFRHCLAEKLTTFALGRGLEYYDKCVVDELQSKLKQGGDKFSALALAIVESEPFQKRRGKRSE